MSAPPVLTSVQDGIGTITLNRPEARNALNQAMRPALAAAIAQMLEERAEVERVHYPFLASHPQYALAKQQMAAGGTLVTFDIKGGKEATFRFLDALRVIDISNNLGDSKSLITHPATTTHSLSSFL